MYGFTARIAIDVNHGRASIALHLLCRRHPKPNLTFSSFHVIGCVIVLSTSEAAGPTNISSAYGSNVFWSTLFHFPSLHALIVALEHLDGIKALAKAHPELCKPSVERRLHYHRLAVGGSPSLSGNNSKEPSWSAIDPESLQPTGELIHVALSPLVSSWFHYSDKDTQTKSGKMRILSLKT